MSEGDLRRSATGLLGVLVPVADHVVGRLERREIVVDDTAHEWYEVVVPSRLPFPEARAFLFACDDELFLARIEPSVTELLEDEPLPPRAASVGHELHRAREIRARRGVADGLIDSLDRSRTSGSLVGVEIEIAWKRTSSVATVNRFGV